jgi:hypothetical protein
MDGIKMKYSEQATAMVLTMKEFNIEEFEAWVLNNLVVGSNTMLEYIMMKKKESEKKTGA